VECAWADKDKKRFSKYTGTWLDGDTIENVTHWMRQDWMYNNFYIPLYGPGIKNRILYIWRRFRKGASDMAQDIRPRAWKRGNAQLDKKVIYYKDKSGKISLGLPENYSAPKGCEKIICNNVFEAERLSEAQRRQERAEWNAHMEERRSIEEPGLNEIRRNRQTLIANARNNLNRDFLIAAQERLGNRPKPWEHERESFLHNEGYEERR
jgi:hypothetical protein